MKWLWIVLPLLLLGCTNTNEPRDLTPAPSPIIQSPHSWDRFSTDLFGFDYPANMETSNSSGNFYGVHYIPNSTQPAERLIVTYVNTNQKYGYNQNEVYLNNPTKTAADLLVDGKNADQILSRAYHLSNITEFTIAKQYYVASFGFKVNDFNTTYDGYALSIFIPEHSLHLSIKVLALNPELSYNMKEAILRSLRTD